MASPVLKFFNPNLPTKVSSDASKKGLGAILEQKCMCECGVHHVVYMYASVGWMLEHQPDQVNFNVIV